MTFPRQAMILSLVLPLLATLLIGAGGVLLIARWSAHEARATTEVLGRADAVHTGSGDIESIDVVWTDPAGELHQTKLTPKPGTSWPNFQDFHLRYDPGDPSGQAFPTAADTNRVEAPAPPWWVLLVALPYLLLSLGFGIAWWRRRHSARSAAAGAESTWRIVPLVETGTAGLGSTREYTTRVHVLLLPPDATDAEVEAVTAGWSAVLPAGGRWQPVMWNEAFNRLTPGQTVTARSGADGARAVLDTADGPVWPAGRLRDKPFNRGSRVSGYHAVPSGSRVLPGRLYTVAPLAGLLVSAPLGLIGRTGLLFPLAILLGYGILMFTWAWRGGLPAAV